MKKILLSPEKLEKFSIVDNKDYEYLSQWKWQYHADKQGGGYAKRNKHLGKDADGNNKRRKVAMHQEIMPCNAGMNIDHINGDKLDNRRKNLRICTPQQNQFNSKRRSGRFKGVFFESDRKKWKAAIGHNGKVINLGRYDTAIEAAIAYNKAAKKYFGKYASLNKVRK